MYNQDILKEILTKYDFDQAVSICEGISLMYAMKYENCDNNIDCMSEYDYERDWWANAAAGLKNKDEVCLQKIS